jgi:hypothetical protein
MVGSILETMMSTPYPTKTDARKMAYRPSNKEAEKVFKAINGRIFGDILEVPPVRLKRVRKAWGWCDGQYKEKHGIWIPYTKEIIMYPNYPSIHLFVATLGHEMVHHWQWTINSIERIAQGKKPLMSHGPSFYQWRDVFKKNGLPLTRSM